VLALIVAGSVGVGVAAAAGQVNLNRVVLRAVQVGPGYQLHQRPDGQGVRGLVTLDLCGFTFPSERLRTARLQVNYVHPGNVVGVSNEVVTYRRGGAAQALAEVTHAAAHCPHGPVKSTVVGVPPLTYRITRLTDPRLLPGYAAFLVHLTGTVRGRRLSETDVAVYQIHADVLSGVYGYGSTLAMRRQVTLHAAEQSAKNLLRG
jgi:hypothetical protein